MISDDVCDGKKGAEETSESVLGGGLKSHLARHRKLCFKLSTIVAWVSKKLTVITFYSHP